MDPKCVMKKATVDTRISEVHPLRLPRFVFSFSERGTRPEEAVGTVTAQHCGLLGCRVCEASNPGSEQTREARILERLGRVQVFLCRCVCPGVVLDIREGQPRLPSD